MEITEIRVVTHQQGPGTVKVVDGAWQFVPDRAWEAKGWLKPQKGWTAEAVCEAFGMEVETR